MRLLLDSHAFLWFCAGDTALSVPARAAIENEANETFVSHATAWEIAIKLGLGKLTLSAAYEELFPGAVLSNGFQELAPRFQHYQDLLTLPMHHRDPFDRLLIAQARVEGMALVSADPYFPAYGVPIIW